MGLYALVFKYSLISFSSTEYVTIIFKVHLLHWNLWKTTKWIRIANVYRTIHTILKAGEVLYYLNPFWQFNEV